ncbi:DUF2142 domain-containing protein [Beduini massiliensis]|uniref:DUF2142 domain-containing protein n=1 Tax=Beduini massiliensis TaxID=1585974 RepID=UPI00059A7D8B|nr:DUF2142 domain-containing protein [Beduini massiliensis]
MKNRSVSKQFIFLALIFGFIMMIVIPPFQSPDEDSHFKKAYVISRGDFYPSINEEKVGYFLPDKMLSYINEKLNYIGDLDKKESYKDVLYGERDTSGFQNYTFQSFSTDSVIPLGHLAPAIGIFTGKVLGYIFGLEHFSTVYMLYFARLGCLIFYIAMVWLAIRITPVFKKSFMLIGLLPMSLALAATVSYDGLLISLALLAVALTLRLFLNEEESLNWKYLAVFSIIGVIFLNIKMVYSFVMVPLVCLPLKKSFDWKKSFKFIAALGFIILAGTFLIKFPVPSINVASGETSLTSQQVNYILNHPGNMINVLYNEMFVNRFFYLSGMVGIFGLLDTYLPVFIYIGVLIFIIILIFLDANSYDGKLNIWFKSINILSFCVGVIGIFIAFYILWTPMMPGYGIGADSISGVQGRYFIPLLVLLPIMFQSHRISNNPYIKKYKTVCLDNCYLLPIIALSVSVMTICFRYWAI